MDLFAEIAVSDEILSTVAARLRAIEYEVGWSRTAMIGKLILDTFFEGDVDLWRRRKHARGHSLRLLAMRDDCPVKKSALAQAVRVYVLLLDEPEIAQLGHITPSHVECTFQLEPSARRILLREAAERNLSVRSLARRVRTIRSACRADRLEPDEAGSVGRRAAAECLKAFELLRRARLALEDAGDPASSNALDDVLSGLEDELHMLQARRATAERASYRPISCTVPESRKDLQHWSAAE